MHTVHYSFQWFIENLIYKCCVYGVVTHCQGVADEDEVPKLRQQEKSADDVEEIRQIIPSQIQGQQLRPEANEHIDNL